MTTLLDNARNWALEAGQLLMQHFEGDHPPDIVSGPEVKSFATQLDLQIQHSIHAHIAKAYPKHSFVGEEEGDQDQVDQNGYTWVVDPLDGTLNFYFGVPLFVVAIGVLKDGVPHLGVIYDPYHQEMFSAERNQGPATYSHLVSGATRALQAPNLSRLDEAIIMTHLTSDPSKQKEFIEGGALTRLASHARHIRMLGCGQLALSYVSRGRFHAFVDNYTYPWDVVAGHVILTAAGGVVSDIDGSPWTFQSQGVVAACSANIHRALVSLLST